MSTETKNLSLFIHGAGQAQHREAADDLTLVNLLAGIGVTEIGSLLIFIGEPVGALIEPLELEEGEDDHEPVDAFILLKELDINYPTHIHFHHCKRIRVTVHYQAQSKHHRFSPAATIETITLWARRKFKLTDVDASRLILTIADTNQQPRPTQHVGELVVENTCSISFNLTAEHKIEG